MKRALILLVAGSILSGMAAYASTGTPVIATASVPVR